MDARLIGPKRRFAPVKAWFSSWATGTPSVYPLVIVGDAGVGKTTVAHHYATEAGFDTIESHAEDERDTARLGRLFADARMPTFFGQRRVVIVEEPESLSKREWRAFDDPMKSKAFPLVIITQDPSSVPWPIRRGGLVVALDAPTPSDLSEYIERLHPGRSDVDEIARRATTWRQAALLAMTTEEGSPIREVENRYRTRYGHAEVAAILAGEHDSPDFSSHPLAVIQAAEYNGADPNHVVTAMLLHSQAWTVDGLAEVSRAYLSTLRASSTDRPPFRQREIRGASRIV